MLPRPLPGSALCRYRPSPYAFPSFAFLPASSLPPLPHFFGGVQQRRYSRAGFAEAIKGGPTLQDFLRSGVDRPEGEVEIVLPSSYPSDDSETLIGRGRTVYLETYGCQMNVSDSEIVRAVMEKAGFTAASTAETADVVFLNTCAIREKAEQKVWDRLNYLKNIKKRDKAHKKIVGVLGCMAERLKTQLLEADCMVDLVVGPDAYRSLPALLTKVDGGSTAMNVQLSLDETYADIAPVRHADNKISAFLSIMRGCDNMCSYCIVPFTRGRERSRPMASIIDEVKMLSDQGFKEVVLLGQNVNSYNDLSGNDETLPEGDTLSAGFRNMSKRRRGHRFAELVDQIAQIDPEMRIRFTSPHPKDFPDDLLHVIRDRPNVCNSLHIPAQSGNSDVLQRMRRLYTREAYLSLIDRIRELVPEVSLSSDFISGFCGESEAEHQDTLSLLHTVQYDTAFMFLYSMREKTHAHRNLIDDIPWETKRRRQQEVSDAFYSIAAKKALKEIGTRHLVLVEGTSRRSENELVGRTDTNKKVVFPKMHVRTGLQGSPTTLAPIELGSYVVVDVHSTQGVTLRGAPIARSSIADFSRARPQATSAWHF